MVSGLEFQVVFIMPMMGINPRAQSWTATISEAH
jgi:hypothetical protein